MRWDWNGPRQKCYAQAHAQLSVSLAVRRYVDMCEMNETEKVVQKCVITIIVSGVTAAPRLNMHPFNNEKFAICNYDDDDGNSFSANIHISSAAVRQWIGWDIYNVGGTCGEHCCEQWFGNIDVCVTMSATTHILAIKNLVHISLRTGCTLYPDRTIEPMMPLAPLPPLVSSWRNNSTI